MTMRLLDLYCCSGGAGRGYQRAGFHVTGFDINDQPRYAGDAFERRDVLLVSPEEIRARFDAVHASPKCQALTSLRHAPGTKEHPNQIPATLALLNDAGLPWILENVEGAEPWMPNAITLCGSMFVGLESEGAWLKRHRLFIASFDIAPPGPCRHDPERPVGGVYGGHARRRSRRFGGRGTRDGWRAGHRVAMSELMGIDWATCHEMSEAVPPAYTEWLGRQLANEVARHRHDA